MRVRFTISANHLVYDAIISRFSCLLFFFFYAAALLGPPLPGPYLLTYSLTYSLGCDARSGIDSPATDAHATAGSPEGRLLELLESTTLAQVRLEMQADGEFVLTAAAEAGFDI